MHVVIFEGGYWDIFAPLSGISAVSPSNAWAVGNYLIRSSIATLVLHWNGIRWAKVASPAPALPRLRVD